MGLPATHKTVTKEDRGEDNKNRDWLIKQSIVREVPHRFTLHDTEKVNKIIAAIIVVMNQKNESSSTFCNACGNN